MAEERTQRPRNDDVHAILAENVHKYRKQAGLTQERLSELCGLHPSYVGRLERDPDNRNPELSTIKLLADYFQVSVVDLLSRTKRRNR